MAPVKKRQPKKKVITRQSRSVRVSTTSSDQQEMPITENATEVYEVEKIVGKRKSATGTTEFCVKWVGYDSSSNTWEPEAHLTDCRESINEFLEVQKKAEEIAQIEDIASTSSINLDQAIAHLFERPYDREPERIIDTAVLRGIIYFKVMYKDDEKIYTVPGIIVREKWQWLIGEYYRRKGFQYSG